MFEKHMIIYEIGCKGNLASEDNEVMLLERETPALRVKVSNTPEKEFRLLDTRKAINDCFLNSLLKITVCAAFEKRILERVEELRNERDNTKNIFYLIAEGSMNLKQEEVKLYDCGSFGLYEKADNIKEFNLSSDNQNYIDASLLSFLMTFSQNDVPHIEQIGEVFYLVDLDADKIFYRLPHLSAQAAGVVYRSLKHDSLERMQNNILRLNNNGWNSLPINHLIESIVNKNDSLGSYVAAWAALESFVNLSFENKFKIEWQMGGQENEFRLKSFCKNLNQPNIKRDSLVEKFIIFSLLNEVVNPIDEVEQFQSLYKIRNNLFHKNIRISKLPTENIQTKFMKYLDLVLE